MILISKYIIPKGFVGLTLYPFIILKDKTLKENRTLINHEKIHLKQQIELLIIFFYLIYITEWLLKCFKYRNRYLAYQNISFEREAYLYEYDFNYTKTKRLWSFIKYF